MRDAWIDIDLSAIADNQRTLAGLATPAEVCAVVKADGYGHGATRVATTALAAGATMVGVAMAEEGALLRAEGIDAPILVLSEPRPADMGDVVALGLTPTVYSRRAVEAAGAAAAAAGKTLGVHLKVDTGMHRVGTTPDDARVLARLIGDHPNLKLEGSFTHLAVADQPKNQFTEVQLERFLAITGRFSDAGLSPGRRHVANSAATILWPQTRLDMVRRGIAMYGLDPAPGVDLGVVLRPALSVKARVSHVEEVAAGEALSYGLRYRLGQDSTIAVVPLGYADGIRRSLSELGAQVLIGGRRRPVAGTVTMDQTIIDCGPGSGVSVGDEVVLLGAQGKEEITAQEWADRLGTITYEITCSFGHRLRKNHLGAP